MDGEPGGHVPEDQVTIDPDFLPSPPKTGRSGWLPLSVLAIGAFMLGWLLRSPTPGALEATEVPTSTTAPLQPTTSTTQTSTTQRSVTTTSTTVPEMSGLAMPFEAAAPGFADMITLTVSSGPWGANVEVLRWLPSQGTLESVRSFRPEDDQAWFAGLDAAGTWYSLHDEQGVLSASRARAMADDEGWWATAPEAVGLRVVSSAWHDIEPGRLAWVGCPRATGGSGTLYTLDLVVPLAEPVAVASIEGACNGSAETWISRWGDWGFALGKEVWIEESDRELDRTSTVLLDAGGAELARVEQSDGSVEVIATGPSSVVLREATDEGAPSTILLSLRDQRRSPVPGLQEGEWVAQAWWSPDGSRIALVLPGTEANQARIRIVDAVSGETVGEIVEPDSEASQGCWSSDGRFLLFGRAIGSEGRMDTSLVAYDTAVGAIVVEVPFPEGHDIRAIRTIDPAAAAQLVPLEWRIALDDAGPGVHTVHLIADTGLLMPDQIGELSGRLIWAETVVDLCGISLRGEDGGFLPIGDVFQTTEGCGSNPTAMQDAFDAFGLPETACLAIRSDDLDQEYCAPLPAYPTN